MQGPFLTILGRLVGALVLAVGLWGLGACDTVPAPDRTQQAPSVSALQVVPDSIRQSDLPPDRVEGSTARVPLQLSARATDPDGTVMRVVFVLEPSSNPRGTISGRLSPVPQTESLYGGELTLTLPLVDEIYTVRVFAVDDDSLASNQVTGQLRFIPTDSSGTASVRALSE